MSAADRVHRDQSERARREKGNEHLAHAFEERDFLKRLFGQKEQKIEPDRRDRTDDRREQDVEIKGKIGGIDCKFESGKHGVHPEAHQRPQQIAGQHGDDHRGKRADEHFRRKPLVRLFERERHSRERRVERDGKPCARTARDLIPPHRRVALQQIARAVPARAADGEARAFAPRRKPHENGKQRRRERRGQHLPPLITDQSARRALRLRDPASADDGQKFQHPADDDGAERKRQKEQWNKRGMIAEKPVISGGKFFRHGSEHIVQRYDDPRKQTRKPADNDNLRAVSGFIADTFHKIFHSDHYTTFHIKSKRFPLCVA